MACSSTTTRMRRTGPPALRIRYARFPTPVSRRRFIGMRSLTVTRPTSRYSRSRSALRRSAIRTRIWTHAPGSLEKLLELAAKDEAAGLGDAPWPPHFRKMEGEAPRVAPSRAKSAAKSRRVKMPLIVVANSPDKAAALAGLERWKSKHAGIAGSACGRRRTGRLYARQVFHLDAYSSQSAPCPGRVAAAAGNSRS